MQSRWLPAWRMGSDLSSGYLPTRGEVALRARVAPTDVLLTFFYRAVVGDSQPAVRGSEGTGMLLPPIPLHSGCQLRAAAAPTGDATGDAARESLARAQVSVGFKPLGWFGEFCVMQNSA